ncbi:MAG TPA: hypothetical protein VNA57_00045 [Acidimicrobiales bacterium]|nr:hypothetical protein [Acidimicrobiales bacterium]
MDETRREGTPAVMAAGRFEVVDEQGRVRAVMGDLSGSAPGWYPGVALLDEHGVQRVWVLLTEIGPTLSFSEQGNVVLELGVSDRGDPHIQTPGPFVVLCERHGQAMWAVRVGPGGEVVVIGQGHGEMEDDPSQ